MSISDRYSSWAATYDQDPNLTRDLDQRATGELLAGRRFASILELGCGTGKNTRLLAGLAPRVLALDFSPGMLELARAKLAGAGHVSFAAADLTQPWPCDDAGADLIICNLVLEHIADLGWIFAEARRVLQPGGAFLVSELHPFKQYLGSAANFRRGGEQISIPAFTHHLSDFTAAAEGAGLALAGLREWWDNDDRALPPRLLTLVFKG
ncbi:MAG TPA: class I SAM-dependent methyltransferase [Herpetosiphonaceae bacterium]